MGNGADVSKAIASPTKDFFIKMLVADVRLDYAIIDLVDNGVDGAIRASGGTTNYKKYWVRITVNEKEFKISDNCGGIDVDLARNYAFRFGRPSDAKLLKGSIGNYGVGMKRSLFKMGNRFVVESTTENSHFKVDVDVDKWRKKDDGTDWTFDMKDIDNEKHPPEQIGTKIEVTQLHEGVSQDFAQSGWISELHDEMRSREEENIGKGLLISLNEYPLTSEPICLHRLSRKIVPAHRYLQFKAAKRSRINVSVFAGTFESIPRDAGWYVYCNARLILKADQSAVTGWSDLSQPSMPKYHNQYAMFRGYAFFESEDPAFLPWNTSKTGIDEGNEVYRSAKLEMTEMMRPVIDFLNDYDKENEYPENQRPLHGLIKKASNVGVADLKVSRDFKYPRKDKAKPGDETTIKYTRPTDKVKRAMKVLGVRTTREVGERTFDAFYEEACEE
jgi:hypothetical protein